MHRARPSRPGRAVALVGLAVLLTACSSSTSDDDADLVPAAAPSGWDSHELGAVSLSTPTDWTTYEPEPPTDEGSDASAYGLKAPVPANGAGSGVYAVTVGTPTRDAEASSANTRSVGEATLGAQDIVEQTLTWPGADAAAYLSYEADLPMPTGDDVRFTYEYLTLDLPDHTQAIVSVVGPASTYDEIGLHAVLASVTVRS